MKLIIKTLVVIILFAIILFPILLASNYKVGYIELYINNYKHIPRFNDRDNFVFSFGIKNNNPDNKLIEYLFIQETSDYIEISQEKLLLKGNEQRNFYYYINQTEQTSKYTVMIPNTNQRVHFWIKPNVTEVTDKLPELDPMLPWEKQDPLIKAIYRYD